MLQRKNGSRRARVTAFSACLALVACSTTKDTSAVATATDVGKPCRASSECESGNCVPLVGAPLGGDLRGVCSQTCNADAQCVAGWSCTPVPGGASVCARGSEVCDGKDNDCNGIVDDEPAVDQACGALAQCTRGACTCKAGATSCAEGRGCVDLTKDSSDCGACGVGCGPGTSCRDSSCRCGVKGAACVTGGAATNTCGLDEQCHTVDVLWSSTGYNLGSVTLGTTDLVVVATYNVVSAVQSIAKSPAPPWKVTAIDNGGHTRFAAALDGAKLAYATQPNASSTGPDPKPAVSLYACDDATCSAGKRLLVGDDPLRRLFVVEGCVYWTNASDVLARCAHAGCGGVPETFGAIAPTAIVAADPSGIYVATTDGAIRTLPLAGGVGVTITTAALGVKAMAIEGDRLYWSTTAGLFSCPKTGCSGAPPLVAPASADVFTVDAARIYWASGSGTPNAALFTCPKSGCAAGEPIIALDERTRKPTWMGQDAGYLYVASAVSLARITK